MIFFAKKQSGSPHVRTSLPPHYRASLWLNNRPRVPPLVGPELGFMLSKLFTTFNMKHHISAFHSPPNCVNSPVPTAPFQAHLDLPTLSFSHLERGSWQRRMGVNDDRAVACFLKVKVLVTQSCPALCHPMDCSQPSSSVHGILQERILESCCCC